MATPSEPASAATASRRRRAAAGVAQVAVELPSSPIVSDNDSDGDDGYSGSGLDLMSDGEDDNVGGAASARPATRSAARRSTRGAAGDEHEDDSIDLLSPGTVHATGRGRQARSKTRVQPASRTAASTATRRVTRSSAHAK